MHVSLPLITYNYTCVPFDVSFIYTIQYIFMYACVCSVVMNQSGVNLYNYI